MGEIAEGIMEGLLCQECGSYIDDDPPGHPRTCGGCQESEPAGEDDGPLTPDQAHEKAWKEDRKF